MLPESLQEIKPSDTVDLRVSAQGGPLSGSASLSVSASNRWSMPRKTRPVTRTVTASFMGFAITYRGITMPLTKKCSSTMITWTSAFVASFVRYTPFRLRLEKRDPEHEGDRG